MFWNQRYLRSDFHCLTLWRVAGEQLSFCKTTGTHPEQNERSQLKEASSGEIEEKEGKKKEKNWHILWLWGEEKQPQVDQFCNVV